MESCRRGVFISILGVLVSLLVLLAVAVYFGYFSGLPLLLPWQEKCLA